ncbi:hypothetical protein, partial [Escherichia coli]|uniref:hypothetical protein n=1 Tax=Escherichia coli TaxID=562 RepID=UPI0023ECFA63
RWRVFSSLGRYGRAAYSSTYARFSSEYGFPNLLISIRVLLTRNLYLSSSIIIFLLTKFIVKVA